MSWKTNGQEVVLHGPCPGCGTKISVTMYVNHTPFYDSCATEEWEDIMEFPTACECETRLLLKFKLQLVEIVPRE